MTGLGELYHRYLTGLILALVVEHGEDRAVDAVFGLFRRHISNGSCPGWPSSALPTCQTPWPAPSTTTCRTTSAGSGWRSYPKATPRLGSLHPTPLDLRRHRAGRHPDQGGSGHAARLARSQRHLPRQPPAWVRGTSQTMDGGPGLIGYYNEYDHVLEPEERVAFRFGEDPSPGRPVGHADPGGRRLAGRPAGQGGPQLLDGLRPQPHRRADRTARTVGRRWAAVPDRASHRHAVLVCGHRRSAGNAGRAAGSAVGGPRRPGVGLGVAGRRATGWRCR